MRGVVVVALCALAVGVTGCGSSGGGQLSKADYKVAIGKIVAEINAANRTVQQKELAATTVPDAVAALRTFADQQDTIGDKIEKLAPPTDAEQVNDKLAETQHDDADAIRKVLPKLSTFSTVDQMIGYLRTQPAPESAKEQDVALSELGALGYISGF
jgi:hypothetical protein